ncbi:alpha/beta fold hydrolase [Gordonia amarae]|nr:alpha/beta fold hydrolase [Gordonia amarae]QHN24203.1 alpha/beta fold hydrolase [Gordonia amarae]QHN33119.1 alpha/beta fold hydrolase [Gordonia amarae]QHN41844.1 alpha/beta fold hydrolase [Gordonia amarae]
MTGATTQSAVPRGAVSLRFDSAGTECDAWYFEGAKRSPFDVGGRRPVVVMAHGFAGTKDSGLAPFAQRFADAGLAVFVFDYRGFGRSEGAPRQRVSMAGQAVDYTSAIDAAATLPGVDPRRIILWGVSLGAGLVLKAAPRRGDIAAVIAVVPLVNGIAAGNHARSHVSGAGMARSAVAAIGSTVAAKIGRSPMMMRVVGYPGDTDAALSAPGFFERYRAIAGPTWRNEIDAAIGMEIGSFKVGKEVGDIDAPVLFQIADFDSGAPPEAAAKVAFTARAEVRHYPCDHFDVFAGNDWHEATVQHEIDFLTRHLTKPERAAQ